MLKKTNNDLDYWNEKQTQFNREYNLKKVKASGFSQKQKRELKILFVGIGEGYNSLKLNYERHIFIRTLKDILNTKI